MKNKHIIFLLILVLFTMTIKAQNMEKATLGAGCFWCVEAVFQQLKGVADVQSGYSGGNTENPTYKEVCTGETGHAEVIQITFDPRVLVCARSNYAQSARS